MRPPSRGEMDDPDPDGWDLSDDDDGPADAPAAPAAGGDERQGDEDVSDERQGDEDVSAAQEERDGQRIPGQRIDIFGNPWSGDEEDGDGDDDGDDEDDEDEDDSHHHGGWSDFSIKTPWERMVHNIESAVRRWLRLTDEDLAAQSSRCARPEHGGRDLRCLRTLIHHKMDHFRPDPYAVILYYPKHSPPNVKKKDAIKGSNVEDDAATTTSADKDEDADEPPMLTHRFYCPPHDDNRAGTSGMQRWLGVDCPFVVVEPPASYSRCFADGDETATVVSAVVIALVNTNAPSCWAVVAPTGGPSRGAFLGRAGGVTYDAGGWGMKIETDSLSGVAAESARGRSLAGIAMVLEETLVDVDWDRATAERMKKARATARLTFSTNRRWASERARRDRAERRREKQTGDAKADAGEKESGWGDGDGWGFSSDDSDEHDDDTRPGAAFMALAGGQRVRAHKRSASKGGGGLGLDEEDEVGSGSDGSDFGITLNEWDDEAPWAPWASLDDPWESVELDCGWVDAPLRELVDRDYVFFGDEDDDEKELDEYDPRRYGKDMLVPTNAPTWTLRAVPTGAFREDGSGGMAGELSAAAKRFDLGAGIFSERTAFGGSYSNAAVDDGDELDGKDDGPGGVGLAEMLWLLAASGGLRALKGADTVSRLASAEYWDEVGSNYDESDGFGVADPPRVPPESVLQDVLRDVFDTGGAGRKARKTSGGKDSNTASMGNQSAKNANAESLFPTPRKSAPPHSLLARVALHAMQFGNVRAVAMLWQRFVREVRFAHWDRGVPLPRAENSENSANDFPETAPDVLACVLHQKLQMLNACIHRRVARREAEFAESGVSALGPTPLAGMVIKSAIRQDSVETQNWEDATGDGWNDGLGDELDAWNDPSATNNGDGWEDPDDGIDLASMLGGAIADKTKKNDPAAEEQIANDPKAAAAAAADDVSALDETRSEDYGSASDGETDGGWRWDDGDVDGDPDAPPEGVKGEMPGGLRMLRPPHRTMAEPIAQLPPLYTEDMMREREAALSALGDTDEGRGIRLKMQSDMLVSDMSAFKAANPGSCLADFIRWHSPRDWISPEDDDKVGKRGPRSAIAPPRGMLSERMRNEGNAWRTLWRDSPRLPASKQKPLFDPIKEGEKALHYLEQAPPPEIFAQLCAAATSAVGNLYASSKGAKLAPCPEYLARAAEAAGRVLNNPAGSPVAEDDYAALAGELQRAERCVARGEALRHRLPGVAPRLLEEILRATAADEEKRDEHNAAVAAKKAAATTDPSRDDPSHPDHGERADGSSSEDDDAEGGGVEDEEALERLRSRPVEVAVKDDERGPLARLLPPDLERGAESASCAEYAVRCGGGDEQIQRAHVLAAPCFTRVTSAIAYQY